MRRKIISSCGFAPDDLVVEIGAGRGEMTRLIASCVGTVYAVEIDPALCGLLREELGACANAEVINKDILEFDFNVKGIKEAVSAGRKIKVFGNIPYYITSPIIELLLRHRDKIGTIFVTVQKEYARRMAAKPGSGDWGSFSCFVQYYAEPKVMFDIKKTCFLPPPKVDSSFLRLNIRSLPPVKPGDEEMFFKIIRQAFNQRRKTLRNSLSALVERGCLDGFFDRYGIDPDIRPEKFSLQDFANLANSFCLLESA